LNRVIQGVCLEVLKTFEDNSIDAVVTDPPYGISFMGKKWDYDVPVVEVWEEVLRVLKPGGHALIACGTRTQHRMAVNIEDAGFEIRDLVAWIYGSGFPKSLDISKAIDKANGTEKIVGKGKAGKTALGQASDWNKTYDPHEFNITEPNSPDAIKWQGWGTALKPAMELWTLARKPIEGTVANNILKHGCGGLNIDGCRVEGQKRSTEFKNPDSKGQWGNVEQQKDWDNTQGRFPANLIHDGSKEVVREFPQSKGQQGDVKGTEPSSITNGIYGKYADRLSTLKRNDEGSAARFFYCAKASKADRDEGLSEFIRKSTCEHSKRTGQNNSPQRPDGSSRKPALSRNYHPTVKPTKLMQYLCRMITPPGGVILDPYCGSGSTGKAAVKEGFQFIGIEREQEYVDIARARIAHEEGSEQQQALF
jgi:DNA modification methylase